MSKSGPTGTIRRTIRPGDEVDARCGRCGDVRAHQVIALGAGGSPERVVCRTCGGQRKYRNPHAEQVVRRTGDGAARAATPRAATRTQAAHADLPPGRPYNPRATFAVGETLEHPKFGRGAVVEARAGKIDVKFSDGLRTLLHAG
jgi:hypothetical protein